MENTIFFTGGGTAGHVFPGLAVIDELKKNWKGKIIWVGSNKGPEKKMVLDSGLPFIGIPAGKMRRYFSLRNFIDIFKIGFGFVKSNAICRKYSPCLVFSKGGYVSVPLVFAAGRRGVPVIAHESDTDPGLATRLGSRYAKKICVAFPSTAAYFDEKVRERIVVTGNPVRRMMMEGSRERGRNLLGVPEGRNVLFILGGSQGAKQINDLIAPLIPELKGRYFIAHQMGSLSYMPSDDPMYKTFDFIGGEMADVLAAADLVVSRAGANSLAEISFMEKPCILIPLMGGAGRGDQVKNAALYEKKQAAVNLSGDMAASDNLLRAITDIMENPGLREEMARRIKTLARDDAAEKVAAEILAAVNGEA